MTKQQLLEHLKNNEHMLADWQVRLGMQENEINNLKYNLSNRTKDLEIMQITINDVEEKNRDLNVKILELRKALKTVSQYL